MRHRTSDGWLDLRANKPADQDKHGQRDPYGRGGIQVSIDQDTNNLCANDVVGEIERIRRYSRCLSNSNGHDDCSSEFRRLKNAQSDFESAVADYENECG